MDDTSGKQFRSKEMTDSNEPHSNKRDYECNTNLSATAGVDKSESAINTITKEVEVQTFYTVLPHYQSSKEMATVVNNQATQTTITCSPDKSESKIFPLMKGHLSHDKTNGR